jgi:photosystem II stability/assembly factor-like uncharacterized protein
VTANLNAISFNGVNGVCTGTNGTLLFTTNGGLNWTTAVDGFLTTFYGIHMVSATTALACGVNTIFQPLIARTTNGGANWSYSVFYLNSNEGNLRGVHFINPSEGFTVSNVWNGQGGISLTTNGGVNWTTQLFTNSLNGVDFTGNTGYAVGFTGTVLKTTDKGVNWTPQTSNTSAILRNVDFVDSLNGYAVGDGGVIIKTTNGGITAITPISSEIPNSFMLYQNYPNPFNPSTSIKFQIPKSGFATLRIYDALGMEIYTLINEQLNPGIYDVKWNASSYPSGVYFYRLTSGNFTDTKKLIFAK